MDLWFKGGNESENTAIKRLLASPRFCYASNVMIIMSIKRLTSSK